MLTLLAQTELNIRDVVKTEEVLPGHELAVASGAGDSGFAEFTGYIFTALFSIAGLLLLLYFIWGGIDWITSGGDNGKVSSARNKITQAAIGLIVLASSFVIVIIIQTVFNLELINFTNNNTGTISRNINTSGKAYISSQYCEFKENTTCVQIGNRYYPKEYK